MHGAISVKDIKREHVRRFYTENEPLGPAAQRVHRRNVNSMLNVALSEGWIDGNPAHGLKLSNAAQIDTGDDADDDGFPFSPTQLRNILAKAETEWADDKEMLLALRVLVYSGARAGEVCQLRCDQIETIEGIPGMRIRAEHSTQSVKNKPSRRVVPLHPKIAADVLAQSENGSEWLFPSFPHHRRAHHADKLQAAFNGRFDHKHGRYLGLLRRACGITDKNLTLHSTRHSFITACRAAGVPDSTWERITGHGKKTVSERYGTVPLIVLASAMASVDPLR